MVALHPAQVLDELMVVLVLGLVRLRSRAELKSRTGERELVNAIGQVVCGTVDTHVIHRDRIYIVRAVVDVDVARTEFVDQRRREEMCLRYGENRSFTGS